MARALIVPGGRCEISAPSAVMLERHPEPARAAPTPRVRAVLYGWAQRMVPDWAHLRAQLPWRGTRLASRPGPHNGVGTAVRVSFLCGAAHMPSCSAGVGWRPPSGALAVTPTPKHCHAATVILAVVVRDP